MKLYEHNEKEFKLLLNSLDYVLNVDDHDSYRVRNIIIEQLENFDQSELGKILELIDNAILSKYKVYSENKNCWETLLSLLKIQYLEISRIEPLFSNDENQFLVLRLNLAYALYFDENEMIKAIIDIISNLKYFNQNQLLDLLELLYKAKITSKTYMKQENILNELILKIEESLDKFKKHQYSLKSTNYIS